MIDLVQISKNVLIRLSTLDYEKDEGYSSEQLIFPKKIQAKEAKHKNRISEQELRLLFIEEFKNANPNLFYSIETPTIDKFKVGKFYDTIKYDENGQSALLDMCIFERVSGIYNRVLNIEFKHKNRSIKRSGKDVLKLIQEKSNGAFIHLLENTDSGTLCNLNKTGVLDKLYKSFSDFKGNWNNGEKSIQLIILSLEQTEKKKKNKINAPVLIHRKITQSDLNILEDIFFINDKCDSINDINRNGWTTISEF